MKKIIKQWGSSLGILFDKEDVEILKLREGEIVDIEIQKEEKKK